MFESKKCILIVDDDMRMRKAVGDFLIGKGYHVIEAENGVIALEKFYQNNNVIDLILLDIMMPKMNGFSVLNDLRENSLVPIIMLSARGSENDQLSGFTQGADDYITKPFSPALLTARIESLLRRVGKYSHKSISVGELNVDTVKKRVEISGEELVLTQKEYDLLLYFLINQGIPLTRGQILNSVWSYDYFGDGRTVDTHVKQLRAKLTPQCDFIKTVRGMGYKFEVPS